MANKKKTKQYTILQDNNEYDLSSRVKELLNSGWKLQGGIAIVNTNSHKGILFYQSLYRSY